MRENPFDNFNAFKPMFCETVGYKSNWKGNQFETQLDECAVFPFETLEPLTDFDVESDVKKMTIMISKDCWGRTSQPKVGDEITLYDNEKFKVTNVKTSNGYFDLTTRSV